MRITIQNDSPISVENGRCDYILPGGRKSRCFFAVPEKLTIYDQQGREIAQVDATSTFNISGIS